MVPVVLAEAILIWVHRPTRDVLTDLKFCLLGWWRRKEMGRILRRRPPVTRWLVVNLVFIHGIVGNVAHKLTFLDSRALYRFWSAHQIVKGIILLKNLVLFLRIWTILRWIDQERGVSQSLSVAGLESPVLHLVGPVMRIEDCFELPLFKSLITCKKILGSQVIVGWWLSAEKVLGPRSVIHKILIYSNYYLRSNIPL